MKPTQPLKQPPASLVWTAAFKHLAPALPQKQDSKSGKQGA